MIDRSLFTTAQIAIFEQIKLKYDYINLIQGKLLFLVLMDS